VSLQGYRGILININSYNGKGNGYPFNLAFNRVEKELAKAFNGI